MPGTELKNATPLDFPLLPRYFSNSPEFWLGIQTEHDLREERERLAEELKSIGSLA